jgi:hypothetical protein
MLCNEVLCQAGGGDIDTYKKNSEKCLVMILYHVLKYFSGTKTL